MKSFVREFGPTIVAILVATLVVTSLAGGSETAFYMTACAGMAIGLWRQARKEGTSS